MSKKDSCLGCELRTVGCHATCLYFSQDKARREEIKRLRAIEENADRVTLGDKGHETLFKKRAYKRI